MKAVGLIGMLVVGAVACGGAGDQEPISFEGASQVTPQATAPSGAAAPGGTSSVVTLEEFQDCCTNTSGCMLAAPPHADICYCIPGTSRDNFNKCIAGADASFSISTSQAVTTSGPGR